MFQSPQWDNVDRPDCDRDMRKALNAAYLEERSPSIHERYLKFIKSELTTEQLNLVIEAHNKKKLRRDSTTILACADELFERAANSRN